MMPKLIFMVEDIVVPIFWFASPPRHLPPTIGGFCTTGTSSMSWKERGKLSRRTCLRSCPHGWTRVRPIAYSRRTNFKHSPQLISVLEHST
jgi:hypothetical protein